MEDSLSRGELKQIPKVEERVLLKLLKYKKKDLSKIRYLIEEGYEIAYSLSKPMYIYRVFKVSELPRHPVFERAEYVALSLCTIGKELEEEASRLTKRGELLKGLIVDILGSEIVEMVADYANCLLCKKGMESGFYSGKRFSPGYGVFELHWQKNIFSLLPGSSIGIELLPSMMMIPRKSISFAVNFFRRKEWAGSSLLCRFCDKVDCTERKN